MAASGYSGVGLFVGRMWQALERPAQPEFPSTETRIATVDIGDLTVASVYSELSGGDFAKMKFLGRPWITPGAVYATAASWCCLVI